MDYPGNEMNGTLTTGAVGWTGHPATPPQIFSPGCSNDSNSMVTGLPQTTLSTPSLSSEDIENYLIADLGQRYRRRAESVVLSVVYSVIFLTGVVGNVSTCIVIARNTYMHTATNYYLFTLAISDVLTLILGLPPELYTIWEAYPWRLGEPYCLFKTFLTEMTSSASILTITAFTVERYVAICHPYRAQTMSSLSRAVKIIICIWITACLTSLPYPIHTRTYHYVFVPNTTQPLEDSLICNIRPEWMPFMRYVFQFSVFILFVIPMALITWLYILIGITLRHSAGLSRQASDISGSPQQCQSRRAVLKMLVAVVVAFFLCWAPFHAQRLMTAFIKEKEWTATLIEIQSHLFYISGVLYFVSATVNPILYNLMSKKYRMAFKETLCRCCGYTSRPLTGRNRMWFFSERSTTYYSVAAHNSVKIPPDRATTVRFKRPLSNYCRDAPNNIRLLDVKPTDLSTAPTGCLKTAQNIHKTSAVNNTFSDDRQQGRDVVLRHQEDIICAPVCSPEDDSTGSSLSSPGTIAGRLREEHELTNFKSTPTTSNHK